ncbi:hypothetical protein IMZ48_17670 [Candidatus Bathyarchaeota archaeon]|nr:hypothetical protein [Candidatus Bathyarchaeota archaeon]
MAIIGHPDAPRSPEEVPGYVKKLKEMDLPRTSRIRACVDDEVKDPALAEKLKGWYPTWCKRPFFHDDYLAAFNQDNVTLIDTSGKGLDHLRLAPDAIVVGNESYPVDVVVFATGFRTFFGQTPAGTGNVEILGRGGVSMSEEWERSGPSTLHGILDSKFPNLFLTALPQAGISGSGTYNLDQSAKHAAYIASETLRRAKGRPVSVATSAEAAEEWAEQVILRAPALGAMLGCTPGYYNAEGGIDRISPERQLVAARSGTWGSGFEDYLSIIEAWREEGGMRGMEVQT